HEQAEAEIAKSQTKIPKEQEDLALAQCYEAVGKSDAARRHYDLAVAARPQDAAVLRSLAGFCVRNNRLAEAERLLRRLTERQISATDEDAAWARRNLAWVRAATGGREGLVEALGLAAFRLEADETLSPPDRNSPPNRPRAHQQARARVPPAHNRRSFRRQAIAILEELNKEESLGPDDLYLLAQLHETDGNW